MLPFTIKQLRYVITSPCRYYQLCGIANATLILGKTLDDIIGFDAGPGNCLLDMYIRQLTQGREQMDRDGGYALAVLYTQPH